MLHERNNFVNRTFKYLFEKPGGAVLKMEGKQCGRIRRRGRRTAWILPRLWKIRREAHPDTATARRGRRIRGRILNGGIVEYARCRTSHTVALEDETYCYCTLESAMPFAEYLPYAKREQERAKAARSIEEDAADTGDLLFISTLPWLSHTALVQPVPAPADSNPRITWGRFYAEGEKTLLPVSVLCNHALVDGLHIAAFYRRLEAEMAALCAQP